MNGRSTSRRRLRALLGPDSVAVTQSLIALTLSAVTAVVAGVMLATFTDKLRELPGLLLLVPAAIALRGNVFGALGSRLGTAIHAGTFRFGFRADSVLGQNMWAGAVLSLALSVVIAGLARAVAVAFDLSPTMTLSEFVVVSAVGGLLASAVVMAFTLLLTAGSVRFGWDLDNVNSPLVTATGDLVTVPALILATWFVGHGGATVALAAGLAVVALIGTVQAARSGPDMVARIIRESLPVLAMAGLFDLVAGVTIEKRIDEFLTNEALLILLPGYLGLAGALGGILSSRLSTGLHLGVVAPSMLPGRAARRQVRAVFLLAFPVFILLGAMAQLAAEVGDFSGPGLGRLLGVTLFGGVLATIFVIAVAYYGTLLAVRLGLDPDTYGIPLVTSSLDVVGSFTLIVAIAVWGLS